MDEEFITFRTFNSIEEAEPVLSVLNDKGIESKAVNPANNLNSSFGGIRNPYEVQVLVKPDDFKKAEDALMDSARQSVAVVDKEHYLTGFTDAELVELIEKPDEWSEEDYLLAQQLLKERGHEVNEATLEKFRNQRMDDLRQPEKPDKIWIVTGYICALLGGFIGIFMGWLYMTSKKLLPTGERVYAYDEATRKEGSRIFIFGLFAFVVYVVLIIIKFMSRITY